MVKDFLILLGIEIKRQQGNELICVCPWCSSDHLSVNATSGKWRCFHGCAAGYPYQLVQKLKGLVHKDILAYVAKYGLDSPVKSKPAAPVNRKQPQIEPEDISELSTADQAVFAKAKNLDPATMMLLDLKKHAVLPIVLLPVWDPAWMVQPCGYIRAGLDGSPVTVRTLEGDKWVDKKERYPLVKDSTPGLVGLLNVIQKNPEIIIFAEGWRDALAAMSLGYAAVAGSHGAATVRDAFRQAFRDRRVYIIFDRDEAGRIGAEKQAANIVGFAREVRVVELPYDYTKTKGKDLHDYIREDKHGLAEVQYLLDNTPIWQPKDGIVLADAGVTTIVEVFQKYNPQYRYNIVDGWSEYKDGRYYRIKDRETMEGIIRQFLLRCKLKKKKDAEAEEVQYFAAPLPDTAKSRTSVENIINWMKCPDYGFLIPRRLNAPACLDETKDIGRIIAMRNGLLDVSDVAAPKLLPFTQNIYTFNYLGFDYDPTATAPTWLWALGEYFQDDDGKLDQLAIDILHSWIKKFIFRDTSHQKIFALIGRPRSGKGTIGRAIKGLMHDENVASIDLTYLPERFGLEPLLDKSLGIMWDATINNRESSKAVGRLKSISGEDSFTVDRKNATQVEVRLRLNLLMIANKILDLRDSTGALAGRFTFLETTKSFYGHEDPTVEARIHQELPGIFNLALKADDKIVEHPVSIANRGEFEQLSSPYIAFICQWCDRDKDNFIPVSLLHAYYCEWARQNRHIEPSPQKFSVELRVAVDGIKRFRPRMTDLQLRQMKDVYSIADIPDLCDGLDLRPYSYKGIDIGEDFKSQLAKAVGKRR